MNNTILTLLIHAVVGLAIIGALAALAATGVITGAIAFPAILGIGTLLLGTGSSAVGASTSTPTVPPASTPALPS